MSVPTNTSACNAGHGSALLDAGLRYWARNWTVFPTKGKRPRVSWKGFQKTPPDDATLRRLFSRSDIDGIAVVLGSASNDLCCRDFDDFASYERWAETHAQLANTLPTVETHRGRHLYFRGPAGFTKFADGEYRATPRQFTVLPPSRHPAGSIYRWLNPLPEGELPFVDPFEVGLCNREDREDREGAEDGENRANTSLLLSSPSSLFSAPSLLQDVADAIAATLPNSQGQRHRCIFYLARHLKSIQALQNAEAKTLRPIVEEWHRRAFPVIGTKSFVDTWADFVHAWKRVRAPAGESPMVTALERAIASVPHPTVIKLYGEGPIILLVALCRELQKIVGDSEFYLDCRTAGRLIGVDHASAWRYLEVLCADGILAPGAKGSKATRKASRFRFIE